MTEIEIMQRAKMYMDKLADGVNPLNDEILYNDTVLNNERLSRCFSYVSGVLQQVIENGGKVGKNRRESGTTAKSFVLTPQLQANLKPAGHELKISELTRLLKSTAGDDSMKRPPAMLFTEWLVEKGFMENIINGEGKQQRVPTEAGNRLGLRAESFSSTRGEYMVVYYSPKAQQYIIDHLAEILNRKKSLQD